MARDLELIKLRDKRIHEVYDRMRAKKAQGKRVHTVEYILHVISTEHVFVSVETIKRVLYTSKKG